MPTQWCAQRIVLFESPFGGVERGEGDGLLAPRKTVCDDILLDGRHETVWHARTCRHRNVPARPQVDEATTSRA